MPEVYWDDLDVGFEREGGAFKFTEADILRFANEFDPRPTHTDPEAAKDTLFEGLAAAGMHTMAAWSRLWWEINPGFAQQAGAEMTRLRLLNPVRPGDELRLWYRVTDKRAHPFRRELGFFETEHKLIAQDGRTVMHVFCRIAMERRPK